MHALPVARKVAVHVDPADAVLVDGAVAVVVDALAHGRVAGPGALPLGIAHQDAVVVRVENPVAVVVAVAHLRDPAVAVQVLGGILVGGAVFVLVDGVGGAAERLVVDEREVGAVGVELGADVKGAEIEQRGDARVAAVTVQEMADDVGGDGGARQLARVDAAVDVERRFVGRGAGGLVGDGDEHEGLAAVAFADLVELGEVGVEGVELAQDLVGLGGRVEAVPVDGAVGGHEAGGLGGGGGRGEGGEDGGQRGRGEAVHGVSPCGGWCRSPRSWGLCCAGGKPVAALHGVSLRLLQPPGNPDGPPFLAGRVQRLAASGKFNRGA